MSDLEGTIRTLARNGRLNHVSVGFSNGKWCAAYRGVDDRDGRIFEDRDPIVALIGALTGRKIAPPVQPKVVKKTTAVDEDLL